MNKSSIIAGSYMAGILPIRRKPLTSNQSPEVEILCTVYLFSSKRMKRSTVKNVLHYKQQKLNKRAF